MDGIEGPKREPHLYLFPSPLVFQCPCVGTGVQPGAARLSLNLPTETTKSLPDKIRIFFYVSDYITYVIVGIGRHPFFTYRL